MRKSVEEIRNEIKYWSVTWWRRVKRGFHKADSAVRWLCQRRTLDFIFVLLILAGCIFMLRVTYILLWETSHIWLYFPNSNEEKFSEDSYGLLRPLFFSIGGVGAAIGLWFADRRQKTLSAQVQVQIDQSFNDRLGRGVELLAKDDMVMRNAGVRVLENLHNTANETQKPIIGNIIYDFFCNKVKIKKGEIRDDVDNKCQTTHEDENPQDLQNALNFIIDMPLDEREKLYPNLLVKKRIKLQNLDFSYLDFSGKKLKNIDFSGSRFCQTKFNRVNIENIWMEKTKFEHITFHNSKFHNCMALKSTFNNVLFERIRIDGFYFDNGKIIDSRFFSSLIKQLSFYHMEIEQSTFYDTHIERPIFVHNKFTKVNFDKTKFLGAHFITKHKMKVSSKNDLPYFMHSYIGYTEFDFADELNPYEFFELCYFSINDWSSAESIPIDLSRGFVDVDGIYTFVLFEEDSKNESWSGQPTTSWVLREIIKWKLEHAMIFGYDAAELEDELAKAEERLQDAQAKLKIRLDRHRQKEPPP